MMLFTTMKSGCRLRAWAPPLLVAACLTSGARPAFAATALLTPHWAAPVETSGCEEPWFPEPALVSLPAGGMLLGSGRELTRVDTNGNVLWQYTTATPCPVDSTPGDWIADTAIDADANAWIAERRGAFFSTPSTYSFTLHRLDAQGMVAASLQPTRNDTRRVTSARLAASGTSMATVLSWQDPQAWGDPRLSWLLFDANGDIVQQHDMTIADAQEELGVRALDVLDGGDLLATLQHRVHTFCPPLHPCDNTERLTLIRLAPDGTERWRFATDRALSAPALQPDGSAWLVLYDGHLQHIGADGSVAPPTSIAGLEPYEYPYSIHGPVADRLLLVSDYGLRLLDTAGNQHASALIPTAPVWEDVNWNVDAIVATASGFLLPLLHSTDDCAMAVLLHPGSLAERYRFDSAEGCTPAAPLAFAAGRANAAEDGTLHVGTWAYPHVPVDLLSTPVPLLKMLRFGLPGTPAGGLLFRDGFDP